MKVLLVSEGAHELEGALQALVTRLGLADCELSLTNVRGDIHVHHGKGQGYFKRAVRWMLEAQKLGYDALVLVIDQDKFPERIAEITQAQFYDKTPIRRAMGVAIRTFDAWMLADEQALTTVLGYPVPRRRDPEAIRHPKTECNGLRIKSERSMTLAEMYSPTASIINLQILEDRCPDGFAPFAQRMRQLTIA